MNYLLDSNVLSEPTRRVPDPNVLRHLREHRSKVVTAAPVIHELPYGAATNGLTLVTRNLADFRRFRDLRTANWFEA